MKGVKLVVRDCVQVSVDQTALSNNFKLLAEALDQLSELTGTVTNMNKELSSLKLKLTKH
jgi:hypothetical protein